MEIDFTDINHYKRIGTLIVVSGASGTGKSTICKAIIESDFNIEFSISCTTRKPRDKEKEGKDYYFISVDKFNNLIEEDEFLEYANVHGNYYGTLKSEVINRLTKGKDVLLDIDVQGAMSIKANFRDDKLLSKSCEFIFILPPSLEEMERRLRGRKTDSEEVIARRLSVAKKEISYFPKYGYFVVNDKLEKAIADLQTIINSFKNKTARLTF